MNYFFYVVTILFVIALAYLTTYYISIVYRKGQSQKYIKVIDKVNLAADKHLWLIEFGEKYYFMYSDRKGMTKIDAVDSLPEKSVDLPPPIPMPFQALLNKKQGSNRDES